MTSAGEADTSVINYPLESAGERVGWVEIREPHGQAFSAYVVTATVGENGATVITNSLMQDSDSTLVTQRVSGFNNIKAFDIVLSEGDESDERTADVLELAGPSASSNEALITEVWRGHYEPETQWASDRQGLLTLIRDGLDLVGKVDFYPEVYYSLNGTVAQPRLPDVDKRKSLLFPDPRMIDMTEGQLDHANYLVTALRLEDLAQLNTLIALHQSDLTKSLETFKASRLGVANKEAVIAERIKRLPFRNFMFLPRTTGRMLLSLDSVEVDRAYVNEIQSIEEGHTDIVEGVIARERLELLHRIDFAGLASLSLRDLLRAEQEAHEQS